MNHEKRSITRTESQGKRERHHYKGSVTQTQTAGYSAHSNNYTCPTNTKSSQTRLEVPLGQLFMNGYRHKENRMDVFPDTQLLHGGLSTRLPCKSMEQMHCPGVTVHFFVSWGLFHDRFRLFKFADSFIDCFTNSCGNYMRFPF